MPYITGGEEYRLDILNTIEPSEITNVETFQPEVMFNFNEVVKGIQKELKSKEKFTPKANRTFNYKFECQACRKMFNRSQMAEIKGSKYKTLCRSCALKRGWVQCSKCGGYNGTNSCPCKFTKDSSPTVLAYNYRPDWTEFRNKNDAYLFGIEIELELRGHPLKLTQEVYDLPWILYKFDGSLSDHGTGGFEIVTMPLGWEWMKEHKEEFNVIFDLAKLGLKSKLTNTCGMHVHINKEIFSTFHLFKFYNFHYKNPKLLHYISGRTWDNMNKWANVDEKDLKQSKLYAKHKTSGVRHSAVNLLNPETVEVRIFKGTLASEPFWRNIEFVKAVCDYTRYAHVNTLSDMELFRDYVQENKKEFPHLYEYLCEKVKGEILCV